MDKEILSKERDNGQRDCIKSLYMFGLTTWHSFALKVSTWDIYLNQTWAFIDQPTSLQQHLPFTLDQPTNLHPCFFSV